MKLVNKYSNKGSLCPSEYTPNLVDQSKYRAHIKELVISYPDVLFFDPQKKFCANGACKIIDNGMLLYSDWNHLSQYGSAFLAPDLFDQIKSKWQKTAADVRK